MELQMQLVQAVHVLNHDMLSCNRVAANQWLVQFQQTDAAWQVATGILTAEALNIHDFEVELFAAQILKRKIHSDIGTLLPDGRRALQNALLVSATKHSSGPSQLLTQICLALSALIFRSPEARSLIQQLFGRLYELQCQGSGSHAVLELLTVLPEEVTEEKTIVANVNSDHRRQFSDELLSHSSSVLKFLVHLTENEAHFYTVRIGCLLEIDQLAVPSHPLIAFAFACLQVRESFSVAIEVLAELINRHEVIPPAVVLQMIVVKDTLLLPALGTGNEVVVKGLCWLMAELGQSAPGLFARGTPDVLSLEEAMLGCTRFQSSNWEVAETSLPFWSALGDYLINLGFEKQSGLRAYIPLYISLLDALVLRVQVGPKSYNEDDIDGSTGLPDSLAQFRINLEETTTTVCRLLGPTQYVTQLLSQITLELPVLWQVIEAQFFLLYAASEAILDGPALDLSSLVNVFLAISEERPETVAG
ncbi:transportin MOS14 [Selaginella moellendorffii]|uniref:transportin MOS14 n=1 Tax=Selaginella moellendorffii TaxID=88036 RepID=UPI000D1C972E|nr:transportin MOS14 [Selaginella moellendorffii]|eukprot:XP_024525819.1 transportin MOS14 [Selaginella moellendorffii]